MGNGQGRSTTRSRRKSIGSRFGERIEQSEPDGDTSLVSTSNSPIKGTIDVFVKDQNCSYHLQIQPCTKIQHVKVILLAQYGVTLNPDQGLIYNDSEMEDSGTLLDYNFTSGHSLKISYIDQTDNSPEGQLIDAALKGNLSMVKQMFDAGVDVNAKGDHKSNKGRTALHAASQGGHVEVMKYLLQVGAFVNSTDDDELTPIHVVSTFGHVGVFQLLLDKGADIQVRAKGKALVHSSAIGGQVEMLEHLDKICDINATTDEEDETPLHLAASHGNLTTVYWLVERGVNFNLRDKRGRTAEDLAKAGGHHEIVTYLYHWTLIQQRKFLQAAAQGDLVTLVAFFKLGVDVECRSQDDGKWGYRAIHVASLHGHTDAVNALLYVGARRDAEDDMGNTAMHYAAAGGQIGTMKSLKNEECKLYICNNLNMTPLHFAAASGQLAAAAWLLAQGIQANITSTTGLTAVDIAGKQQHFALVDVIHKHQASQMSKAKATDAVVIDRELGRGSFGEVYLASMNHRKIVVKKIKFNESNLREMELAAQELLLLKHLKHPNIVTYMGSRKQDKQLHILMEYCSGGDLSKRIRQQQSRNEHFEETLLMTWTSKIASALNYIHGRKVVHRDLKPANIFVSGSGSIKLGDFGLAVMGSKLFIKKSFAGAPAYMSPEVLHHKPYDEKADMWSFGCILYELAALKRINQDTEVKIPERFSSNYKNLVTSLLKKDYTERPSSSEVINLPFLKSFQSKYKHQQQHHHHLNEIHKELERPMNELMKKLLIS